MVFAYPQKVRGSITGSPRIVLFFGGKKTPYYVKSVLFGDYFSTITSEMGENVFQSPLF